jgi:hypothetical protein
MRFVTFLAMVSLVSFGSALSGCESQEQAAAKAAVAALHSLPATLEGELDMSVGEGDDSEDDVEMLYGFLTVGEEELYIQVDSRLLDSAGISTESARVRATIGSKEDLGHDMIHYTITSLTRL